MVVEGCGVQRRGSVRGTVEVVVEAVAASCREAQRGRGTRERETEVRGWGGHTAPCIVCARRRVSDFFVFLFFSFLFCFVFVFLLNMKIIIIIIIIKEVVNNNNKVVKKIK